VRESVGCGGWVRMSFGGWGGWGGCWDRGSACMCQGLVGFAQSAWRKAVSRVASLGAAGDRV